MRWKEKNVAKYLLSRLMSHYSTDEEQWRPSPLCLDNWLNDSRTMVVLGKHSNGPFLSLSVPAVGFSYRATRILFRVFSVDSQKLYIKQLHNKTVNNRRFGDQESCHLVKIRFLHPHFKWKCELNVKHCSVSKAFCRLL